MLCLYAGYVRAVFFLSGLADIIPNRPIDLGSGIVHTAFECHYNAVKTL